MEIYRRLRDTGTGSGRLSLSSTKCEISLSQMREACPFSDCYPWVWFVVRVFSKKKGRKIQIIIELFEHNNIYLQGIDDNNNHVTSSISVQNK